MNRSRQRNRHDIQLLNEEIKTVIEADRKFFLRHPHRSYRVQLESRHEIALDEALGFRYRPAPDTARYTVIKQISPGVRVRLHCDGPRGEDTDLPESTCRALYEALEARRPSIKKIGGSLEAIARVRS